MSPATTGGDAAEQRVRRRIADATASWASGMTLDEIRLGFEGLVADDGPAAVEPVSIGGMAAAWYSAPNASEKRTILYCHGGGFQIGSLRSHAGLMVRLSAASGARVLGFDYRLAPEHRFPAAADDALAAWRWLLDGGIDPASAAIAGDSAGGGLALGVASRARDEELALPGAIVLISPWLDLALRGDSYRTRTELDIFSRPQQLAAMARTYLGRGGNPLDPHASPIEAEFHDLPPVLVHAGDHDITLDDSTLLMQRLAEAGVPAELRVWQRMFHHFQIFPELPQAQESVAEIGRFLHEKLGSAGG